MVMDLVSTCSSLYNIIYHLISLIYLWLFAIGVVLVFISAQRIVLTQWITDPVVREIYARKVRVAVEDNTEHVIDLALGAVCAIPKRR